MRNRIFTAVFTAALLAAILAVTAFAGEVVTINTADKLSELMQTPGMWDGEYILGADIDLSGKTQEPIGSYSVPFSGSFDGAGHTVKGLNMRASGAVGFFGAVSGSIKNVTVEGSIVNTFTAQNAETKLDGKYAGTGGICGVLLSGGMLEGCTARVSLTGPGNVGGVCGVLYNFGTQTASIVNCIHEGSFSSEYGNCGGIVARVYVASAANPAALIRGCENRSDLTLSSEDRNRLGGIAGYVRTEAGVVSVERCTNTGKVYATNSSASGTHMPYVGGILARVEMVTDASAAVTVSKCINRGKVESPTCSGGIVSYFDRAPTCTDGDVGIYECANYGDVIGNRFAGGVLAYANVRNTMGGTAAILNCLNAGKVKNDTCGAGILGRQYGMSVKNCLNTGAVVASSGFGAIVGKAEGAIYCETDNAYYLWNTSSKDIGVSGDLCVKLNVQMLTEDAAAKQETFAGFDFDLVWKMEDGMPALQMREGTATEGTVTAESPFKATRTYEEQFVDVPATAWFYKFVKMAYEYQLANGTGVDKFSPDGKFTVAQALTAAANIHKVYYAKEVRAARDGEVWYTPYVNYCIDNGIIPYGLFTDYDKNITRGEMAIAFAGILPDKEYSAVRGGTNPDVTLDMACYNAVAKLYQAGIVGGDAGMGNFRPNDEIVRSEACVIFTRIAVTAERTK